VPLFERQVFGRSASWGETFKRFLPHTPSSNAPRSTALVAGIVTKAQASGQHVL